MLNQLRSLAQNTAVYSIGNVSSKLVGFILLPFFTNEAYLTVQAYGVLGLFEGIVQVFITLFGFGIYNGVFRFYFDDKSKQGSLLFTSLLFVVFSSLIVISIGIAWESSFTTLIFWNLPFV